MSRTTWRPIRGLNQDAWKASLDAWRTRADDDAPDREPTMRVDYTCIEPGCDWTSRSGVAAYVHHKAYTPHHRIGLTATPHLGALRWPCCEEK